MDATPEQLKIYIENARKTGLAGSLLDKGELTFRSEAEDLLSLMRFLRDDQTCHFEMLIDICGVDYPARPRRFDVVYHLLSLRHNLRVRVKVETTEEAAVPSLSEIWPSAGWFERECWDLYGIVFSDHGDLRRILTDYGFEGHPLRKDFPLTGHVELRYSEETRSVVYEPVHLVQDYREFDFLSPWQGMTRPPVLPGDEKAAENEETAPDKT